MRIRFWPATGELDLTASAAELTRLGDMVEAGDGSLSYAPERILVAGAGGGFDVYAGLPLALTLKRLGKTVHLANLSFSALDLIGLDDWCAPGLAAIGPATSGHDTYFPERALARWLDSQGLDSTTDLTGTLKDLPGPGPGVFGRPVGRRQVT